MTGCLFPSSWLGERQLVHGVLICCLLKLPAFPNKDPVPTSVHWHLGQEGDPVLWQRLTLVHQEMRVF